MNDEPQPLQSAPIEDVALVKHDLWMDTHVMMVRTAAPDGMGHPTIGGGKTASSLWLSAGRIDPIDGEGQHLELHVENDLSACLGVTWIRRRYRATYNQAPGDENVHRRWIFGTFDDLREARLWLVAQALEHGIPVLQTERWKRCAGPVIADELV